MKTYYKVIQKIGIGTVVKVYDITEENNAVLIIEDTYQDHNQRYSKLKINLTVDKYTNKNYPNINDYQYIEL